MGMTPRYSLIAMISTELHVASGMRTLAGWSAWTLVNHIMDGHHEPDRELFTAGHNQAVRLPAACRFDTKEAFIGHDLKTGDVILSGKPASWDDFFAVLKGAEIPADFLDKTERGHEPHERDPIEGWRE